MPQVFYSFSPLLLFLIFNFFFIFTFASYNWNYAYYGYNQWQYVASDASGDIIGGVAFYSSSSQVGTVVISYNGGYTWTPIYPTGSSSTSTPLKWDAISISNNGQFMTIGAGSSGIYTSHNFGYTGSWNVTLTGISNTVYSLTCSNSGQYLVSGIGTNGIYYSQDYGMTWLLAGGSYYAYGTAMSSNGQYAVATTSNGIYRSTNYGQTWTRVSSTSYTSYYISSSATGQYLATPQGNYILLSSNYGSTWYTSSAYVPSAYSIISNPTGAILTVSCWQYGYLYQSTDYGQSFEIIDNYYTSWTSLASNANVTKIIAASRNNYWGLILGRGNATFHYPTIPDNNVTSDGTPWYFTAQYKSQTSFICYGIFGFLFLMNFVVYFWMKDQKKSLTCRSWISFVNFLMFFILNFYFLCLKFNFFLTHDHKYNAHETELNTYVWATSQYENATVATLQNANCPGNYTIEPYPKVQPIHDITPNKPCKFLFFVFGAGLISDWQVKFSLGLGLIMYLVLVTIVFGIGIATYKKIEESDPDSYFDWNAMYNPIAICQNLGIWTAKYIPKYILGALVTAQQFCVMMLLTNWSANDYCAYPVSPLSPNKTICLMNYGVYALPYVIWFGLGTIPLLGFIGCANESENGCAKMMAFASLLGVLFTGFMFLAFFVYWFFGGIVLGLYFQFGATSATKTFTFNELLSIALYFVNDILRGMSTMFKEIPVKESDRNILAGHSRDLGL